MSGDVTYDRVHEELVAAIPSFAPTVEEHERYFDEILPHVLFGDLTRFVIEAQRRGDEEVVALAPSFLDDAIRSDDPLVVNLVAVSFIESWPRALREEAHRQRAWRPEPTSDPQGT